MSEIRLIRAINDELYLVEVQATLERKADSLHIGDLKIIKEKNSEKKKATLTVDNQYMEGVVESLKKPLAVLQKTNADPVDVYSSPSHELKCCSIIRERIRFSSRPLPTK